jgi:hypothetical protein
MAIGSGFYEAAPGFAGSRNMLELALGLLHFVLQLFYLTHHAHHVECHIQNSNNAPAGASYGSWALV